MNCVLTHSNGHWLEGLTTQYKDRKFSYCDKLEYLLRSVVWFPWNKEVVAVIWHRRIGREKKTREVCCEYHLVLLRCVSISCIESAVMGESSDSVSIDIDLIPLGGKVMPLYHVITLNRTMISPSFSMV